MALPLSQRVSQVIVASGFHCGDICPAPLTVRNVSSCAPLAYFATLRKRSKTQHSFLNFSYLCPEPVLVK
jgi:hypothetical protein